MDTVEGRLDSHTGNSGFEGEVECDNVHNNETVRGFGDSLQGSADGLFLSGGTSP
jgi:hypothetical protein